MREGLAIALMCGGLAFVLAGVIGVLRLPDFYTRLHATSKCDTLGLTLMVAGVAVLMPLSLVTIKVLLVIILVGLVNATAAHALGRAAYRSGVAPWKVEERGPR